MALPTAIAEAYANVRPNKLFLNCVALDHPALAAPLYFATGVDENVTLPPTLNGAPVEFLAVAFTIKLLGSSVKDGYTEGSLELDNVSGDLLPYLEQVAAAGSAIAVTYMDYEVSMVAGVPDYASITGPIQRFEGLRIEQMNVGPTSVSAPLKLKDYGQLNFPRQTFSRALYPALHG